MAVEVQVDNDGVFTLVAEGELTTEEAKKAALAVYSDSRFSEPTKVIWDLRETRVGWKATEVKGFSEFILGNRGSPRGKVAVVASSNMEFGLARMFEALADAAPIEVMVFREFDEAQNWMRGSG